jgi:hypothetical protein
LFCCTCIFSIIISKKYTNITIDFQICTVHRDTIKFFYSPTNAQVIFLKTMLKFTIK